MPSTSVSFTTQIGDIFGQQNFNEESAADRLVALVETDDVSINAGQTKSGVDIVTSDDINVDNFGSRDFNGFTGAPPAASTRSASRRRRSRPPATGRHLELKALAFHTGTVDASVAPCSRRRC